MDNETLQKEYTVSVGKTEQVSEDQWKYRHYYLKIDSNTTMGQIESWIKSKGVTTDVNITINSLEKLK